MIIENPLLHPLVHDDYTGVTSSNHHNAPDEDQVTNTTLTVSPLPGGPAVWDIVIPFDTQVIEYCFNGPKAVAPLSAKAGAWGVAFDQAYRTSGHGFGGWTTTTTANYSHMHSLMTSAYVSQKVFTAAGEYVALSNAYVLQTGPSTKVLRTEWTNIGASNYTLFAKGRIFYVG